MIRYRHAFVHALLVAATACGGDVFTTPGDGDGGPTGTGSTSTTGTGPTTTGATGTTVGSTSTGSTVAATSGSTGTTVGSTTGSGGASGAGTTGSTGSTGGSTTGSGGVGGGNAGSGGRPDGGGGRLDAGSDGPLACDAAAPSAVTFRLRSGGGDYCMNYCLNSWVTLFREGSTQPLVVTRTCTATCSQCQPIACPAIACIAPQHIKPEGETYTWSGTLWEQSKCGAQMLTCTNETCGTSPGKYIARMCAYKSLSDAGPYCMSSTEPTCVDVPFDYPTSAVVEGVLK